MYGTRDAAASWEEFYIKAFVEQGFVSGLYCPCLFWRESDATMVWIHGDDIVVLGGETEVVSVESALKVHMLLKRRALLGWSIGDDQAVTLLNRII
eukprot:5250743-Amphidinium_carterae.1